MELNDLYQEIILDHYRKPRNRGELPSCNRKAEGENPSCGDNITVFLQVNDAGNIEDVKFQGHGCAISQASASMMTIAIKGKPVTEAREIISAFEEMLTGACDTPPAKITGNLRILQGVRFFPERVKCATLAWQALRQAAQE